MEGAHATFANNKTRIHINLAGHPTILSIGDCIRFRRNIAAGENPIRIGRIIKFDSQDAFINRIIYIPWLVAEQRWASLQEQKHIGLELPYLNARGAGEHEWTTITKLANCPTLPPSIAAAPMVGVLDATFLPKAGKERPDARLRIGANEISAMNSLEATEFAEGDEVVVLERATYGFKHVYKRAYLEEWFTGKPPPRAPITGKVLTQADIERYTLHIIHEGGAKKRRSRRRRTMKKRVKSLRNHKA